MWKKKVSVRALLLKKIEELTLYMIELSKVNEKMKDRIGLPETTVQKSEYNLM